MGVDGLTSWTYHRYSSSCALKRANVAEEKGEAEGVVGEGEGKESDTLTASALASLAFDHVLLDLNNILHKLLRRAVHKAFFYQTLFEEIDAIVSTLSIRRSLFIAIDGPGPLAKLLVQRRRRFSTTGSDYRGTSSNPFSPVEITPGTEFMADLKRALCYFAAERIANNKAYKNLSIIVSAGDVPGEGEAKIAERMNEIAFESKEESCVIVGEDSDLFLYGLASKCEKVYLLQDKALWNIAKLRGRMLNLINEVPVKTESSSVLLNFALFCCLSGNDYLPEVQGSGSWRKLWPNFVSSFTSTGRVIVDPKTFALDPKLLLEILNLDPDISNLKTINLSDVQREKVDTFLGGAIWTVKMIREGACPAYRYFYPLPIAPSIVELKSFLTSTSSIKIEFQIKHDMGLVNIPLDPLRSLMACLPPHCSEFLPEEIQEEFVQSFPEDFYDFDASWQPIPPKQTIDELLELVDLADKVPVEDYEHRLVFGTSLRYQRVLQLAEEETPSAARYWFDFGEIEGFLPLGSDNLLQVSCSQLLIGGTATGSHKAKREGEDHGKKKRPRKD